MVVILVLQLVFASESSLASLTRTGVPFSRMRQFSDVTYTNNVSACGVRQLLYTSATVLDCVHPCMLLLHLPVVDDTYITRFCNVSNMCSQVQQSSFQTRLPSRGMEQPGKPVHTLVMNFPLAWPKPFHSD